MHDSTMIRLADIRDAEAVRAIYAPYVENTAITFEYAVPSAAEMAQRMQKTLEKYPYIVAEQSGAVVGYAYAGAFKDRAAYDWAVETTVYVDSQKKRGGIGHMLYSELERLLRLQGVLNLNACIASPREEDEHLERDSIVFHEKMGFRYVGTFSMCGYKFDRWYDMLWMEKHIGEHAVHQKPVIPFCELAI